MNTCDLIRECGVLAVLVTLLLTLTVVVCRLLAVPLAAASLALDATAELAARPLVSIPASTDEESPR